MSNTQHKLDRIRPPRVQITYDVETGGAIEKKELPMVVGILADLSGHREEPLPKLKERKFTQIDRDNFNDVLKSVTPKLKVTVDNKVSKEGGRLAAELKFQHLDDFHPVNVAKQIDPLKKPLGFIFTGMENKWFVDEGYFAVIINPFKKLSQFLADVIDWRFWHDFVHDTVILGTYNWLSEIALNEYADQKGIDGFANWLGSATQSVSATLRKVQNGFVRSYALSVLLGVVLILGYLILK